MESLNCQEPFHLQDNISEKTETNIHYIHVYTVSLKGEGRYSFPLDTL